VLIVVSFLGQRVRGNATLYANTTSFVEVLPYDTPQGAAVGLKLRRGLASRVTR